MAKLKVFVCRDCQSKVVGRDRCGCTVMPKQATDKALARAREVRPEMGQGPGRTRWSPLNRELDMAQHVLGPIPVRDATPQVIAARTRAEAEARARAFNATEGSEREAFLLARGMTPDEITARRAAADSGAVFAQEMYLGEVRLFGEGMADPLKYVVPDADLKQMMPDDSAESFERVQRQRDTTRGARTREASFIANQRRLTARHEAFQKLVPAANARLAKAGLPPLPLKPDGAININLPMPRAMRREAQRVFDEANAYADAHEARYAGQVGTQQVAQELVRLRGLIARLRVQYVDAIVLRDVMELVKRTRDADVATEDAVGFVNAVLVQVGPGALSASAHERATKLDVPLEPALERARGILIGEAKASQKLYKAARAYKTMRPGITAEDTMTGTPVMRLKARINTLIKQATDRLVKLENALRDARESLVQVQSTGR